MSTISGIGSASMDWSQVSSSRKERLFAKADSNGDGTVDTSELQTLLDKGAERTGTTAPNAADLMKTMDTDGSGGLNADELDTGMKSLAPSASSTVEFAQFHGGPPPFDDSASSSDSSSSSDLSDTLQNLFKAADTDGNGSLDSSEVDTLKKYLDSAIESLSSGSSSTDDGSSTSVTSSTGTSTTDSDGSTSSTSSSAPDSMQAAFLELAQLVMKEYASTAAASSSTGTQTASVSITA